MKFHPIESGLCIAIAAVVTVTALQANAPASQASPFDKFETPVSWQIVEYYRADSFVLDHGLTLNDCLAALPHNQPMQKIGFSCERER